jgi:hypothetical protein
MTTLQNRFVRGAVLALTFALLAAVCGPPAHAASSDADLRELTRYTLTLPDLRKYSAANEALTKLPKPAEKEEDADSDDESNDSESLDDMVKRMESVPGARKSIEGAGLTVRQYAVITMAIFQAAFAQFAIEQGADPAKVAKDAGVNPANIRFVKEHKAELEKMKKPGGED